jgi:hypothetical protein
MHLPLSFNRHNDSPFQPWRNARRAILLLALTIGWTGAAFGAPDHPSGRFEQLRQRDLRVATVAYRLSIANRSLCGDILVPQLGFVLHSAEQYDPTDREGAKQAFGLEHHVGVMAVVAGSPAGVAGLKENDQLLSVNGQALDAIPGPVPGRASVERAQGILAAAMKRGPVTLKISTSGGERRVTFAAESGCASNVELVARREVNAWADGARVMVSQGLLAQCATDDDLALVIGHEMAHNLLHHRSRLAAAGISENGLLPLSETGSREMRETEEEADRLAVGMGITAGYDLSAAETFLSRLLISVTPVAATHPDPERRLALLRAAIAEHGAHPAL